MKKTIPRMQMEALKEALLEIFFTESIAGCHVETAAEILSDLPKEKIAPVLSMVRLISYSVSDLLAFSFIEHAADALKVISIENLEDWVEEAISIYESEGLYPAQKYLSRAEETALKFADERRAASIDEASKTLKLLMTGLSGRDLQVKEKEIICTDMENIYAPRVYSRFEEQEKNRLFYKVLFVHKCSQIRYRSFHVPLDELSEKWPVSSFLSLENEEQVTGIEIFLKKVLDFKESPVLYALLDTIRIEARLETEFPGLARDLRHFKHELKKEYKDFKPYGVIPNIIFWMLNHYEEPLKGVDSSVKKVLLGLMEPEKSAVHSGLACRIVREKSPDLNGLEFSRALLPYIGTVRPGAVSRAVLKERKECREKFINILSAVILDQAHHGKKIWGMNDEEEKACQPALFSGDEGIALIFRNQGASDTVFDRSEINECLTLRDQGVLLDEKMKDIISEIESDLGAVPSSYMSGAVGLHQKNGPVWMSRLIFRKPAKTRRLNPIFLFMMNGISEERPTGRTGAP
jgi:nitric oxide reductase NorD protein